MSSPFTQFFLNFIPNCLLLFFPSILSFIWKDFRKQVNYEVDQRFHVSKRNHDERSVTVLSVGCWLFLEGLVWYLVPLLWKSIRMDIQVFYRVFRLKGSPHFFSSYNEFSVYLWEIVKSEHMHLSKWIRQKQALTSNFFCAHSESVIKDCHPYLRSWLLPKMDSDSIIEICQFWRTIIYYLKCLNRAQVSVFVLC